jgi:hypothetical protein
MALKIDWFGIAEGAVNDFRGALTAVGLGVSFIPFETMPANVRLALVLLLVDDEDPEPTVEGRTTIVAVQLAGPEGNVLVASQQTVETGPKIRSDVNGTLALPIMAQLAFPAYGNYTASVAITVPGTETNLSASRVIRVVPTQPPPAVAE